jgi:phospholipid transport system substrate-binding protein
MICRYLLLPALLLTCVQTGMARGTEPMEALQEAVDTGIQILSDSRFQDSAQREVQRRRLWDIVTRTVDFEEFSRLVIGPHWKKFTPRERTEFIEAFAEFLRANYLPKVQQAYSGEEIRYVDQHKTAENKASVEIKVVLKHLQIPLEMRMIKRQDTWRVYDVVVLGISVVRNYRAQFNAILQKSSPAQVILLLRQKTRHIRAENAQ